MTSPTTFLPTLSPTKSSKEGIKENKEKIKVDGGIKK
jgi:hypothetical protein